MTFLRKPGSTVVVWIKSLTMATQCSFCPGSRSHRMNFAMTCFMLILCQNLRYIVFGNPKSASHFYTISHWSLLFAARTCSTFSGILLVANLPERGPLSTGSPPSLKHLCHTFICAALIASSLKAFWIVPIISAEECSSLMLNVMQICWSIHSVILNATATQYTCSLSGIYCPHWLVQWSHHRSHMCIPVHSP